MDFTLPSDRDGSSPLTRGALAGCRLRRWSRGLIPAYAGSTAEEFEYGRAMGAHPRLRGEHRAQFYV